MKNGNKFRRYHVSEGTNKYTVHTKNGNVTFCIRYVGVTDDDYDYSEVIDIPEHIHDAIKSLNK